MVKVHHKIIDNNDVAIFIHPMTHRRMDISILIGSANDVLNWETDNYDKISFSASSGNGKIAGLLEIKRVMPSIVKWIRSIGYTPIADPADNRRYKIFAPIMKKMGINFIN